MKCNLIHLFSVATVVIISCNANTKQEENKPDATKVFDQKITAQPKQQYTATTKISDEKIIDTILKLKEVEARRIYIEQQTKAKRTMQVWIDQQPTNDNKYYWVKAGEDNGGEMVTHFNFFVYPDSMRIMFYDPVTDAELSLDEWRKNNKSSN